jgi:metallo-beta-lactamase family protein
MSASSPVRINFLGAAGTVTGSKYLIESRFQNIMIDCGLFQGVKELRKKNWESLPVNADAVDLLLLTHGHLDHIGFIPRFIKTGFNGPILGTKPTLDIAQIILLDSAKIHEEEAEKANKEGYSKHQPAAPLYTIKDAEKAIAHFKVVPEGEDIDLAEGIRAKFMYNGHIIGSTFIELTLQDKVYVFSGDIGRKQDFLMRSPKRPTRADYLFVESTYGDRLHPTDDPKEQLKQTVLKTIEKGGSLIIPSFAVERTQTIMYLLWQLKAEKEIPDIPMVMDSPMGANVLSVFENNQDWHKLSHAECVHMCEAFKIVSAYKETWETIDDPTPKIIIAGSGMVTGGRVLTYLKYAIQKPETTVLLVGYQAEGSRGRKILDGEKEVKIYGKWFDVKADVEHIEVLSSHADQSEVLDWLSEIESPPKTIFIIHGEPNASETLKEKIKDVYGWNATVPKLLSIAQV